MSLPFVSFGRCRFRHLWVEHYGRKHCARCKKVVR